MSQKAPQGGRSCPEKNFGYISSSPVNLPERRALHNLPPLYKWRNRISPVPTDAHELQHVSKPFQEKYKYHVRYNWLTERKVAFSIFWKRTLLTAPMFASAMGMITNTASKTLGRVLPKKRALKESIVDASVGNQNYNHASLCVELSNYSWRGHLRGDFGESKS